ncbi:MAG: hypothetical protein ACR2OZ_07350 [Verrucomicrobiales bacterium]
MKATSTSRTRGAVLVFALLCSAVAVLGLTGWIITVTARGQYIDELSKGTKRRIARENGRIIATRHVQRRVLPASQGDTFSRGIGAYFPSDEEAGTANNYEWGGVELTSSWSGSILSSATFNVGVNRISYGDTGGFGLRTPDGVGRDLLMSLLDGSQRWSYRWQARSYSPVLTGDLLVVHRPPAGISEVAVTGNLVIHGRAFFWMGPDAVNQPNVDAAVWFESYATSGRALTSRVPTNDVVTNYPPVSHLTWASTVGTQWKATQTSYGIPIHPAIH